MHIVCTVLSLSDVLQLKLKYCHFLKNYAISDFIQQNQSSTMCAHIIDIDKYRPHMLAYAFIDIFVNGQTLSKRELQLYILKNSRTDLKNRYHSIDH